MLKACAAAVLICVMRLDSRAALSMAACAWCLVCELCRLTVIWVGCRCVLSFVILGGARRLELSPFNTPWNGTRCSLPSLSSKAS